MTNDTPAAVAAKYFGALATGDVPGAMGLLSPDLVWHQPGANRFSGDHVGRNGVGQLLGGMMEVGGNTFQLTVTGEAMVNGELVAIPVRFTGHRDGASMDMSGIDLLRVREGMIVEVWLFSSNPEDEDQFWGTKSIA